MRKNNQTKTRSMSWYAGLCVGSTVLVGKTITGALGSGVSTVGGVCSRVVRPRKTATKNVIEKDRTQKQSSGVLAASAARLVNLTLYPIKMVGALPAKLKRAPVAPRAQATLAPARPVVEPSITRTVPREQEALLPPRPREKAFPAPAIPVVAQVAAAAKARSPEVPLPSYRSEKTTFSEVRPEEADAAEFATSVQKIVFKRVLFDFSLQDAASRVHAASAASGIPHPLSMRVLAAQLSRDESAEVRRACLAALAALSMEEGFPAAEHALRDMDASVRVAAVIAVYRLGGPRGAVALARMLRDSDAEVRRMAVSCIGWLRQKDLSDQVAPLLNDDSMHVRLIAIEAISNLRGYQAIPALLERLGDPVSSVRRKAFTVLQEIAGKKMGDRYPENDAERAVLVARWRRWWREEAGHPSSIGSGMEQQQRGG